MTAPLFDLDLLDALEAAVEEGFHGRVWRQIVVGTDPHRTNSMGGRWNAAGVEVLYASLSREGAEVELAALLDRQYPPVTRERVMYEMEVSLSKVARLDHKFLEAAGIDQAALLGDDVTLPQRIGAACEWLGLGGVIVPSARHSSGNLVILAARLAPPDFYEAVGV